MKRWQLIVILIAAAVFVLAIAVFAISRTSQKTVATVNGAPVMEKDIDEQIELIKQQQKGIFNGAKGKDLEKSYRDRFKEQLITNELIRQDALSRNIKVSEKEVKEKYDQVRKLFNNDDKKLEEALKQQGLTPESYKDRIREQLLLEKTVNKEVEGVSVSDEEVAQEYDKNKDKYQEPEQVRVRNIVIKDEKSAKQTLDEIRGGADFAQKAKEKSEDPATQSNGGDYGFKQLNMFPPELGEAIKVMTVGQVSDLVKDANGFNIIKLEEKKEARRRSFDEAKEEIKQRLKLEKQRSKYLAYIELLKKKFKVVDLEK